MNTPNLSGHIKYQTHYFPLRVYYEDTDFSGLVYHASYLRWCERARTEYVRLLGLHQKELFGKDDKDSLFFVVRKMSLDFLSPAFMDDQLEVRTSLREFGKATINLDQMIWRKDKKLFEAEVLLVALNKDGKPQRLTDKIKSYFQT